jgi:hypothetical protein
VTVKQDIARPENACCHPVKNLLYKWQFFNSLLGREELWPPGMKLALRGEDRGPFVRPSILLNSWQCSPLGVKQGVLKFPQGVKVHPWWPSSPLETKLFFIFLLPSCQIVACIKVGMSWPDMAFCFMLGASHHHKDDVGCTSTPLWPIRANLCC